MRVALGLTVSFFFLALFFRTINHLVKVTLTCQSTSIHFFFVWFLFLFLFLSDIFVWLLLLFAHVTYLIFFRPTP